MSAPTILRARLSEDGRVELLDPLPADFQGQREVLITVPSLVQGGVDANGWPLGFFERTYGALADDPLPEVEASHIDGIDGADRQKPVPTEMAS